MAITASIALASGTLTAQQKTTATLTVTNTGSTAVLVTGIRPTEVPNGLTAPSGAVALGVAPFGGPFPQSVAGSSGTTNFYFDVVPLGPQSGYGLMEPSQSIFTIGATVYTNDGSVTAASTANLTVNPPAKQ